MRKPAIPLPKLIDTNQQWKLILLENWQRLTEQFDTKVVLLSISHKAVTLGVLHSIFAQELSYSSIELRDNINRLLPESPIEHIYIKIMLPTKSEISERKSLKKSRPLQKNPQRQYALTMQEQGQLDSIGDGKLKQIMKQFLIRCKKVS